MIYDIIVCHLSASKLFFCSLCLFLYVICSLVCMYVCLSATIMMNKDEYI